MKAKWAACLLAAAVALGGCTAGGTASEAETDAWARVQEAGVLKIGLDPGSYPLSYEENGEFAGLFADTAREACRALGLEAEFVPLDWDRAGEALESGEIDCIFGDCSEAGAELAAAGERLYSEPFAEGEQVVLTRAADGLRNLADLSGKAVGVREQSCGEQALADSTAFRSSLAGVTAYGSYAEAVAALDAGEIAAVVLARATAGEAIAQNDGTYALLTGENGEPEVLAEDRYCVSVSPTSESLIFNLRIAAS